MRMIDGLKMTNQQIFIERIQQSQISYENVEQLDGLNFKKPKW